MPTQSSSAPRSLLRPALLWLCLAALTPSMASATVLYREIFPFRPAGDTTTSQEQQAANEGWYGGNTGDAFAGNIVGGEGAISTSTGASETTAVNSNPQGASTPSSSFGFWSKQGVSNNFFYTNEFSLPSSSLVSVSWDSRNQSNSTNTQDGSAQGQRDENDTHVAFRIGNNWYVSDQGFLQLGDAAAWRSNSVDVASLTWGLFDDFGASPDLTKLPGRSSTMGSGIADLPVGTINAFGVWWERVSAPPGVNGGTNRIDNFTLNGTVPEPATLALLGLGLAGLGVSRRRTH